MTIRTVFLLSALAVLSLALAPVSVASATAEPILDLSFDEDHWLLPPTRRAPNGGPRPILARLDDVLGARHSQVVIDTGSNYKTWLQSEVTWPENPPACTCSTTCPDACAIQRNVMAFQMSPSSVDDPLHRKDKVQLLLSDLENPAATLVPIGGSETHRFVGFEFMLHPSYATPIGRRGPGKFVIHFQLRQGNGHPVFTLQTDLNPDIPGAIDLVFYINNDEIENDFFCANTRVSQREIHRIPNIQRGEWHKLVMQFVPQFKNGCGREDGCGKIAAWVDDSPAPALQFEGDWGYTPGAQLPACRTTRVPGSLQGSLGIYRNLRNGVHTIFFDEVRFGTTFESVNG